MKSIRELALRATAIGELLDATETRITVAILGELLARGGRGDVDVVVTLDGLSAALSRVDLVPYERRRELYSVAYESGDMDVARLFVEVTPPLEDHKLRGAESEARVVVPNGRDLSLGERKSLARVQVRDLVTHVMRDPHPDVVAIVLGNPQVTESDVLILAARRPTLGVCQELIAKHARWAVRPRVKLALVLNPYTPLPVAMRWVIALRNADLNDVAQDPSLFPTLRRHANDILRRRLTREKRGSIGPAARDARGPVH